MLMYLPSKDDDSSSDYNPDQNNGKEKEKA